MIFLKLEWESTSGPINFTFLKSFFFAIDEVCGDLSQIQRLVEEIQTGTSEYSVCG